MAKSGDGKCVFPLTSLQIGDLQTYLSLVSLFLGPKSSRFYVLVDNRPWLGDNVSRSADFWQFVVTQSRSSPFATSKSRRQSKEEIIEMFEFKGSPKPSNDNVKGRDRWFSLIQAATRSHKKALLPMKKLKSSVRLRSKLRRILSSFIVFEVAWDDVRGINYLNQIQTDTSLAVETKFMKRWEFDSISQAASCLSSWFSGTEEEHLFMKECLEVSLGDVFYDAEESFSSTNHLDAEGIHGNYACPKDATSSSNFSVYSAATKNGTGEPQTPPLKKRKVTLTKSIGCDDNIYSEKAQSSSAQNPENSHFNGEVIEPKLYKDVLILIKFDDRDLPHKLKEIIMSDLRLLTLLESGLPSWVVFLQSYPGLRNLYRPWMCPLARAVYVMISFITVLIGFYDLYKNVPILKATAYRLCGPLLDWVETWDMISRIRYLGTMLFLQNFQKAVQWVLMITRTARSFTSVLTRPLAGPLQEVFGFLLPAWDLCVEVSESLYTLVCSGLVSSLRLVSDLMEIILHPVWFVISLIWSIVTSILYPILWILKELLYAPFRLLLTVADIVALVYTSIYVYIAEVWLFIRSIFKIASVSEANLSTGQASIWRSVWNDIFSQVFRALRSILNGFVAFFSVCNRHRLSISNYMREFSRRQFHSDRTSPSTSSEHRELTNEQSARRRVHFD